MVERPTMTDWPVEDPLAYLPHSNIVAYNKGETIYDAFKPSAQLHLIISGTVTIQCEPQAGTEVLVDIYKTDELFGEAALLDSCDVHEKATAFEHTNVMVWSRSEVEKLVVQKPRLGIALLQTLTKRSMDLAQRIESFSSEDIEHRLARSIIRFSERFGDKLEDGSIPMMSISHELLSRYVGTSREIVSMKMAEFRR